MDKTLWWDVAASMWTCGKAYRQGPLGKGDLLVLLKVTPLHALDLAHAKLLGHLERAGDHFLDDVAPMSNPNRRKRSHRND